MRLGEVCAPVAVAIPLAGVLLLGEAQSLRLARHDAGLSNDVHVSPLNRSLAAHASLHGAVLLPQHAFLTLVVVASHRIDVALFLQQTKLAQGFQVQSLQIAGPSPSEHPRSTLSVEGSASLKGAERVLL